MLALASPVTRITQDAPPSLFSKSKSLMVRAKLAVVLETILHVLFPREISSHVFLDASRQFLLQQLKFLPAFFESNFSLSNSSAARVLFDSLAGSLGTILREEDLFLEEKVQTLEQLARPLDRAELGRVAKGYFSGLFGARAEDVLLVAEKVAVEKAALSGEEFLQAWGESTVPPVGTTEMISVVPTGGVISVGEEQESGGAADASQQEPPPPPNKHQHCSNGWEKRSQSCRHTVQQGNGGRETKEPETIVECMEWCEQNVLLPGCKGFSFRNITHTAGKMCFFFVQPCEAGDSQPANTPCTEDWCNYDRCTPPPPEGTGFVSAPTTGAQTPDDPSPPEPSLPSENGTTSTTLESRLRDLLEQAVNRKLVLLLPPLDAYEQANVSDIKIPSVTTVFRDFTTLDTSLAELARRFFLVRAVVREFFHSLSSRQVDGSLSLSSLLDVLANPQFQDLLKAYAKVKDEAVERLSTTTVEQSSTAQIPGRLWKSVSDNEDVLTLLVPVKLVDQHAPRKKSVSKSDFDRWVSLAIAVSVKRCSPRGPLLSASGTSEDHCGGVVEFLALYRDPYADFDLVKFEAFPGAKIRVPGEQEESDWELVQRSDNHNYLVQHLFRKLTGPFLYHASVTHSTRVIYPNLDNENPCPCDVAIPESAWNRLLEEDPDGDSIRLEWTRGDDDSISWNKKYRNRCPNRTGGPFVADEIIATSDRSIVDDDGVSIKILRDEHQQRGWFRRFVDDFLGAEEETEDEKNARLDTEKVDLPPTRVELRNEKGDAALHCVLDLERMYQLLGEDHQESSSDPVESRAFLRREVDEKKHPLALDKARLNGTHVERALMESGGRVLDLPTAKLLRTGVVEEKTRLGKSFWSTTNDVDRFRLQNLKRLVHQAHWESAVVQNDMAHAALRNAGVQAPGASLEQVRRLCVETFFPKYFDSNVGVEVLLSQQAGAPGQDAVEDYTPLEKISRIDSVPPSLGDAVTLLLNNHTTLPARENLTRQLRYLRPQRFKKKSLEVPPPGTSGGAAPAAEHTIQLTKTKQKTQQFSQQSTESQSAQEVNFSALQAAVQANQTTPRELAQPPKPPKSEPKQGDFDTDEDRMGIAWFSKKHYLMEYVEKAWDCISTNTRLTLSHIKQLLPDWFDQHGRWSEFNDRTWLFSAWYDMDMIAPSANVSYLDFNKDVGHSGHAYTKTLSNKDIMAKFYRSSGFHFFAADLMLAEVMLNFARSNNLFGEGVSKETKDLAGQIKEKVEHFVNCWGQDGRDSLAKVEVFLARRVWGSASNQLDLKPDIEGTRTAEEKETYFWVGEKNNGANNKILLPTADTVAQWYNGEVRYKWYPKFLKIQSQYDVQATGLPSEGADRGATLQAFKAEYHDKIVEKFREGLAKIRLRCMEIWHALAQEDNSLYTNNIVKSLRLMASEQAGERVEIRKKAEDIWRSYPGLSMKDKLESSLR